MKSKGAVLLTLLLVTFCMVGSLRAENMKPILKTKILFDAQGKAKISYPTQPTNQQERISSKIESALIFYAYAMNQVEASSRTPLLNQVQKVVSAVATEAGLKRPDILTPNSLAIAKSPKTGENGFDIVFGVLEGSGKSSNSLEVKPIGDTQGLLMPAVFNYLQDLVKNLSDSGLRLTVLALGGMNKWYREVGNAANADSVSKAPAYGLTMAVDLLSKITGQKI